MQPRDDERLVLIQRRQDSGKTAGKHRLARSRRPAHEQVMPARGRDLERALGLLLAVHLGEVDLRRECRAR